MLGTMLACLPSSTLAQPKPEAFDVREHYTKYEYYIPMRDGKKLFVGSAGTGAPDERKEP